MLFTYGDFLNFNPHLHAIVSDGCFLDDGDFHMAPGFMLEDLEEIFQYEVLKMLKKEGKITDSIIENMLSWRHSGFNVYIGDKIFSDDKASLGNLARYIIRACFSQVRKKAETDDDIPAVIPNEMSSKESRQNWARLIQKIYEVDPLICPKCWEQMHIIHVIEELDIIEKILRHLGLWDICNHDPPNPGETVWICQPSRQALNYALTLARPAAAMMPSPNNSRADGSGTVAPASVPEIHPSWLFSTPVLKLSKSVE